MPGVNQKTVIPIEVINAPRIRSVTTSSSSKSTSSAASSSPDETFMVTVEWMDGTKDTYSEEFWNTHPVSPIHIQEMINNANPIFLGRPSMTVLPSPLTTATSTFQPSSASSDKLFSDASTVSSSSSYTNLYVPPVRSPSSSASGSFQSDHPPMDKGIIPRFDYSTVLQNEKQLYFALQAINNYGLIILTNSSTKENTVIDAATRLAYAPMRTLYGLTWDVAVTPQPINIAYAPGPLDFHVDLVYYESPPGLQLLHCRVFDSNVIGGESTFIDGFYAAEVLRKRNPEAFRNLTRLPATFEKIHYNRPEPAHMRTTRPHITVRHSPARSLTTSSLSNTKDDDIVTGIFWAPPFEGPLILHPDDVQAYYSAYGAFANVLADIEKDGKMLIQYRSEPGEIVVFNNRRILHGRRNFSTPVTLPSSSSSSRSAEEIGGRRVLQGCYINADDWKSRLSYLNQKYSTGADSGKKHSVKRVGNQDII